LKFAHVTDAALELIVAVARAADMVILPVGCCACVVTEEQRASVPADLVGSGVELVETAADLATVVRGALPSTG
jgi:hypothetical protein